MIDFGGWRRTLLRSCAEVRRTWWTHTKVGVGRHGRERARARAVAGLLADESRTGLDTLAQTVAALGHEVVPREVTVAAVGAATARLLPDVALVALGLFDEHALQLIKKIVHESECPVITLLAAEDPAYGRRAATHGVFAHIVNSTPGELPRRDRHHPAAVAEYQQLQGAFGRRAVIEQAKGILMARHAISADVAFQMLRAHSQEGGRKLVDLAEAVVAATR